MVFFDLHIMYRQEKLSCDCIEQESVDSKLIYKISSAVLEKKKTVKTKKGLQGHKQDTHLEGGGINLIYIEGVNDLGNTEALQNSLYIL